MATISNKPTAKRTKTINKPAAKPRKTSALVKFHRQWKEDTMSLSAVVKFLQYNIDKNEDLKQAIKPKTTEKFKKGGFKFVKSMLNEKEQTKKFFSAYQVICIINRFEKKK